MLSITFILSLITLLFATPNAAVDLATDMPPKERITWQQHHKLTWSDFKGRPNNTDQHAALSSTMIEAGFEQLNGDVSFFITSYFIPRDSWTKSDNEYLLNHEQRHFDLAEIYARKFRKAVEEHQFNKRTVQADFRKIYTQIVTELRARQDLYDKETNHSLKKEEQEKWDRMIDHQLEMLEAYQEVKIMVAAR